MSSPTAWRGVPLTPPHLRHSPDPSLFPGDPEAPPLLWVSWSDFRQEPQKALPGALYSSQAGGLLGNKHTKPTVKPHVGPKPFGL